MKAAPKKSLQRGAAYASGGAGHMVKPQASGPVRPGTSGKVPTPAPGKRAAAGGPKTSGHSLSVPAKGGRTGPSNVKGR
jgi:hypothetical protein